VNPVTFARAASIEDALATAESDRDTVYIAGGTNVIDLMKDEVARPLMLVDITALPLRTIAAAPEAVWVGALATMADVADAPDIQANFPAVSQALLLSASAQLRNMATVGGNVLQRTRCAYFRDVSQPCNKRRNGQGCSAIDGENRFHSVIGTSPHCICSHPSDLAVALLAVDARVHTRRSTGSRVIDIADLYVLPGDTPNIETTLEHGELIEAIELPISGFARNSAYLKVRDRASYEFALVSVAAALDIVDGTVRTARVTLGGVAPKPWRAYDVERALAGQPASNATFVQAAEIAARGMHGYGKNDFKLTLVPRTVLRALQQAGGVA
jgi:xanthine dehydrogenase YagS FAD-binding subunit